MDVEEATQEVNNLVDRLGSPSRMSKEQYADFLISVREEVGIRLEGVQQDLKREQE